MALFWLLFSSSLIGFGYMIISKILENRTRNNKKDKDEDKKQKENMER